MTLIRNTGGRESPCPTQNIQSQGNESSATPAPMFVVVFAHNYLLGMANPKAALGPKAARAAALIGTTSGQESPCHMQNI